MFLHEQPRLLEYYPEKYIFSPEEETWLRYDERYIIYGPSWQRLVVPINGYERQADDVEVDASMCITGLSLDVDVPKSNWKRLVHKDRNGPSRRPLVVPMAMNVKEKTLK